MRRIKIWLLCCCALACADPPDPVETPAAKTAPAVEAPPLQDYGGIGGDFSLVDQHGEPFALKDLDGRAAMLFFGYTFCPDICPVTLSKMGRVYQLIGEHEEDLATLFISVDPERDTAENLKEYLAYFDIGAIGLHGDKPQIDEVIGQYGGHYSFDKEEGQTDYFVDHSTYTYLIDEKGKVRFLFRQSDGPELMAAVTQQLFANGE